MSAAEGLRRRGRPYDPAMRARAQTKRSYTGVYVYIPGEVLAEAGFTNEPAPWYRLVGHRRSRNAGTVLVSLYREP